MVPLITGRARAYINFGRWVADCPQGCGNAAALQPRQPSFFCEPPGGCGHIGEIEWPVDADELWEALQGRRPKNRNWFPKDHPLALRAGCPHGQTPGDLRAETAQHEEEA